MEGGPVRESRVATAAYSCKQSESHLTARLRVMIAPSKYKFTTVVCTENTTRAHTQRTVFDLTFIIFEQEHYRTSRLLCT